MASEQTCGCKPGDEVSGWHEERCVPCLEAEREVWRAMMVRFDRDRLLRRGIFAPPVPVGSPGKEGK